MSLILVKGKLEKKMDQQSSRKRAADKQLSRGGRDDSDEEQPDTEFKVAAPEVLAARKILVARRPPNADGTPAPSPFAALFRQATAPATTAASSSPLTPSAGFGAVNPFAAGAGFTAPTGFGFGFGKPNAAAVPSPAAPIAPPAAAPQGGFALSTNFNFGEAVNAFAAAKKQVLEEKSSTQPGGDDGSDEDIEREVPIGDGSGSSALPTAADAQVPTGEENEVTEANSPAKLFELLGETETGPKSWKERGSGTVKLNSQTVDGSVKARLIMREDRVKRALLNAPVDSKAFHFVTKADAHIIFTGVGLEGTKVTSYLLRFSASGGKTAADTNKQFIQLLEKHLKPAA